MLRNESRFKMNRRGRGGKQLTNAGGELSAYLAVVLCASVGNIAHGNEVEKMTGGWQPTFQVKVK